MGVPHVNHPFSSGIFPNKHHLFWGYPHSYSYDYKAYSHDHSMTFPRYSKHGVSQISMVQHGPPVDSVQLPYKWLNMVDITIVFMVYKPTNISGVPHPVVTPTLIWWVVTGCHEFYFPIHIGFYMGFLSSSQLTDGQVVQELNRAGHAADLASGHRKRFGWVENKRFQLTRERGQYGKIWEDIGNYGKI